MTGETTAVSSASEMLPLIELTAITSYEIAGRRASSPEADPIGADDLNVMIRGDERSLETRARMHVVSTDAEFVADVSATYTYSHALEVPQEVVTEFVERVGIMTVFPYLREAIHTTASRLGVDQPVLGLIRAGGFRLNLAGEESGEEQLPD